ncbi:MAG: hypothetical protein JOZ81_09745 [Chloroflexi bacterium]|nr:hypothetical protein [Chloroflexota bacterium]
MQDTTIEALLRKSDLGAGLEALLEPGAPPPMTAAAAELNATTVRDWVRFVLAHHRGPL